MLLQLQALTKEIREGREAIAPAGPEISSAHAAAQAAKRERDTQFQQGRQAVAAASSEAVTARSAASAAERERDALLPQQKRQEETF